MTTLSKILAFFPATVMLLSLLSFLWLCGDGGIWAMLALVFWLYGFPLIVYRIHSHFYPIKEGISYLRGPDYSPWWGSSQIQLIYSSFPMLEVVLRLIPGAFSAWLRLWGSQVGQDVYWTPHLDITDRGLLQVGDRVIVGHRVGFYPHTIKPKKDNLVLYIKKIKIGSDVFIGAGCRFTPGAEVESGTFVPTLTDVYPNQKVK